MQNGKHTLWGRHVSQAAVAICPAVQVSGKHTVFAGAWSSCPGDASNEYASKNDVRSHNDDKHAEKPADRHSPTFVDGFPGQPILCWFHHGENSVHTEPQIQIHAPTRHRYGLP